MGGLISDIFGGGGEGAAQDTYREAYKLFEGLDVPQAQDLLKQLQDLQVVGTYRPQNLQTFEGGPTEYGKITEDPRMKSAQMNALSKLQNLSEQGLSATDRARMADIQGELGAQQRGAREAIMQNAQARGVGGSGTELASLLANQQGAAERASRAGTDVAAQAEQRALEALLQSGQLGTQVRGQEYAQAAQKAQAQDAINRFNIANRQNVAQYNVGGMNEAQRMNLAERQRVSDINKTQRNQALMNLTQQQYEDELRKRAGMTQQLGGVAQSQAAQGSKQAGFWGGALGAAGALI
jgi:hypothetical protein